jgi:hypothetical protein
MNRRVFVAALLLGLSGCGRPAAPRPDAGPSRATATVGGVSYEVRGRGDSSASALANGPGRLTAGQNTLRVEGGRVLANGKDYGPVKAGDSVLLDEDGTLTVNGERRAETPAPKHPDQEPRP